MRVYVGSCKLRENISLAVRRLPCGNFPISCVYRVGACRFSKYNCKKDGVDLAIGFGDVGVAESGC